MKFGIIGLGSMGGNLALQALDKGHEVVGASRSEKPDLVEAGVEVVGSPKEVVKAVREGTLDQLSDEIQEYAAERDLVRQTERCIADEQVKKAEKAKQKADTQRKKEGAAEAKKRNAAD